MLGVHVSLVVVDVDGVVVAIAALVDAVALVTRDVDVAVDVRDVDVGVCIIPGRVRRAVCNVLVLIFVAMCDIFFGVGVVIRVVRVVGVVGVVVRVVPDPENEKNDDDNGSKLRLASR